MNTRDLTGFDPKSDPAICQAPCPIRAFGIEFTSRYGVLSELRLMIGVVETWLARGLFWHIAQIAYDSKHGSIRVVLKEREGSLVGSAYQIASIIKTYSGDRCSAVYVVDHQGNALGDSVGVLPSAENARGAPLQPLTPADALTGPYGLSARRETDAGGPTPH
jgi:hypothetical protein